MLIYFMERIKSVRICNVGLVGQRAANLLAVKVGGLKKKSAAQPTMHHAHAAQI